MKCPFCEKEMVEGYVQAARKVFFSESLSEIFIWAGPDDIVLTNHNLTNPRCLAYNCPDCKKIIIEYDLES